MRIGNDTVKIAQTKLIFRKDQNMLRSAVGNSVSAAQSNHIGIDLPDDQINDLVEAVKAKLTVDRIGGVLGGLFGKK